MLRLCCEMTMRCNLCHQNVRSESTLVFGPKELGPDGEWHLSLFGLIMIGRCPCCRMPWPGDFDADDLARIERFFAKQDRKERKRPSRPTGYDPAVAAAIARELQVWVNQPWP